MLLKKNRLMKLFVAFLLISFVFTFNFAYAVPDKDKPVNEPNPGSIKTTDSTGTVVNGNPYAAKDLVYVNGSNFASGSYYLTVTDPSGSVVLGQSAGPVIIPDSNGDFIPTSVFNNVSNGGAAGFATTSNEGGQYKVWVSKTAEYNNSESKTDSFKVVESTVNEPIVVTPPVVEAKGTIIIHKTYKDTVEAEAAAQAGVTFTLSGNGLTSPIAQTTNAAGLVTFAELTAGTYTVTETVPAGYTSNLVNNAAEVILAAGQTQDVNVLNTKNAATLANSEEPSNQENPKNQENPVNQENPGNPGTPDSQSGNPTKQIQAVPEEETLTAPVDEEIIVPTEEDVFAPETEDLPKTGGNTAAYLLSGSVIAAVGALLRKFQK